MQTIIDFSDKCVTYDTFVSDVARAVVSLLSEVRNDPEMVSQRRAFELFGRANVERWRREEKIKPCIRPGKVEYRTAELRALQNRVQDYL